MKSRLCQLLGIKYPIIQAPMGFISCAELVAAVSEAGGMGTLGPEVGIHSQAEAKDPALVARRLVEQIKKVKAATKKPFAVNFPIGWGKQKDDNEYRVKAALEEGISIAIVSMGSPDTYTRLLHDSGIKVIHVVSSVKMARKAEDAGVDAVVCIGVEAGGHLGADEIPTFVLVPQIADAVKIPVIAAGGIADARGFVAALALGAEGVYIGTRFMATDECCTHPNMKQAIVDANDVSTVVFGRRTGISRCLRNDYTTRHIEMEATGASFDELRGFERLSQSAEGWRRVPLAIVAGNTKDGSAACGAIAGAVKDIVPAREVIRRIVEGYQPIMDKVEKLTGD